MEVYISINGVLRNLVEKFDYHYQNNYLESDIEVEGDNKEKEPVFDYEIKTPVQNDNLLDYYTFQSIEEYNNFLFIDFPLEIFGHSTLSYMSAMADLNKLIYDNPEINFTVIGLDEFTKAKTSTLYFLSKHSYLGDNIKFIKSKDFKKEWKKCDVWVTDNKEIIDLTPKNKKAVKFITQYNKFFTHKFETKKITTCLKCLEKTTTSMWTNLLTSVAPSITKKKNSNTSKNLNENTDSSTPENQLMSLKEWEMKQEEETQKELDLQEKTNTN